MAATDPSVPAMLRRDRTILIIGAGGVIELRTPLNRLYFSATCARIPVVGYNAVCEFAAKYFLEPPPGGRSTEDSRCVFDGFCSTGLLVLFSSTKKGRLP
jgi:hypothetical protein